ncbi:MAG: CPBP family glutamic-type intramembrane protease, partial [Actinomycetota bacterium]
PLPLAWRAAGLAGIAAAILVASVVVPVPAAPRHLHPVWVVVVGAVAVAVAALRAGPVVPVPWAGVALPIAVLAAVAEEALFRRVLHAALAPHGALVAIVGGAMLFAAVHVPLYGWAALPVDLGAGVLLGWQRHAAGTWTAPAATHAFANVLAVLA